MPCTRCGACCTQMTFKFTEPTPDDDIERWWLLHGYSVLHDAGRVFVGHDSTCYWYDPLTKSCTHYDERPQVCRRFRCPKSNAEDNPA